jgi:hypothetical protein
MANDVLLLALWHQKGRWRYRVENPHVPTDQKHVHIQRVKSGAGEYSWNADGSRRHPRKFPSNEHGIEGAKDIAAEALGIDRALLQFVLATSGPTQITIDGHRPNDRTHISTLGSIVIFDSERWLVVVAFDER